LNAKCRAPPVKLWTLPVLKRARGHLNPGLGYSCPPMIVHLGCLAGTDPGGGLGGPHGISSVARTGARILPARRWPGPGLTVHSSYLLVSTAAILILPRAAIHSLKCSHATASGPFFLSVWLSASVIHSNTAFGTVLFIGNRMDDSTAADSVPARKMGIFRVMCDPFCPIFFRLHLVQQTHVNRPDSFSYHTIHLRGQAPDRWLAASS
jgi:hypothetical protein